MRHVRWVPVLAVVSLIAATTAARAALWRLTCIDGNPQAVVKVPGEPRQPADWVTCDGIRDGVCTFSVERQICACPGKGCCGYDTFAVSAGRSQVVRDTPGLPTPPPALPAVSGAAAPARRDGVSGRTDALRRRPPPGHVAARSERSVISVISAGAKTRIAGPQKPVPRLT